MLQDAATPPLVADYFTASRDGVPWFTGSWFERIGGGGDRPDVADTITGDDLVAVTTLSVQVVPQAAIWMLGDGQSELASLLAAIPVNASPADLQGAGILRDDDSALAQLWRRFVALPDVGWVTAGKLCARKRPSLAPVYDTHVRQAAGAPERWWAAVADAFEDDDVVAGLVDLQQVARSAGGEVTLLRALDIAIWMRQHGYRWAAHEHRPDGPMVL